MLPRQGVIAAVPDTYNQTQVGCQNEETKKHGPNERRDQNSRKRSKQNEDKQSIRCRVQNTNYEDAQELIGYFNSLKKTQAEMKVTLSEIKKNLQGINSGVDETENQINDLEHKEEKNIQTEWQEEKRKESKK